MNAHSEVRMLLDQIRVLTNNPAVERASDQIEVLTRAYMEPIDQFLPDIHFTPAERRMLDLMRSRLGKTVRKDALLDAIEFLGHPQPSPKSLDVLICRIRAKFRRYTVKYRIETDHSTGFRLCDGAVASWAGAKSSPRKYMMAA